MTEYIKKSDAEAALLDLRKGYRHFQEKCAVDGCRLEIRELPAEDVVLRGVLEQVMWERDIAIGQLESYGVSLGEKADVTKTIHGKWLDGYAVDSNGKKVYDSIDCSNCEELFKIESHDGEYWKNRFKACPFCGAYMDLED